mgnify:CR=1 FL=1
MVSIYRIVLAFSTLYVRDDEAFGGCDKISDLRQFIGRQHLMVLPIFICRDICIHLPKLNCGKLMKAIFIIMMIAYMGGNLYLFVRSLQQLSHLPLWGKVVFGILFWTMALALFVVFGARNVTMPEMVARTMFGIGSAWMVFLLYMVLSLVVVDLMRFALPHFNGYYYALGLTACVWLLELPQSRRCKY